MVEAKRDGGGEEVGDWVAGGSCGGEGETVGF